MKFPSITDSAKTRHGSWQRITEGAAALQLGAEAKPEAVKKNLQSCWVKFGQPDQLGMAVYLPSSPKLAASLAKTDLPFIEALVRLANAGQLKPLE